MYIRKDGKAKKMVVITNIFTYYVYTMKMVAREGGHLFF